MKKRANPFQPIYKICNSGNSKEKLARLPDFPRYIDVELTNRCNFNCLMCAVGVGDITRKRGMMSGGTFEKVAAEIAPHKTPVRFVRWGEPLLHPKLVEYVRRIKAAGSLVHINTNGSLLDEKMIDGLMGAGLDSIKLSFQGVDRKSYREMRNTDFFDELLGKARMIYEKRGDRELPFIHISTTITYETAEQIRAFKEKAQGFVDLLTVGRTVLEHIDVEKVKLTEEEKKTLAYLKSKESVVKKHPECPEVFDKLSINWDGTVSACCSDYDNETLVGDLKAAPLKEIWKSDKMGWYRSMLADMRHGEIKFCSGCYDYHGLQTPGLQNTD